MKDKIYFTKCLPVEGEIKEEDYWRAANGDIIPPGSGERILFHANQTRQKRVKLFLCSRDIQVGDNIIADYIVDKGGEYEMHVHKEGEILNDKDFDDHWQIKTKDTFYQSGYATEWALKKGCFKIIGEISPDALGYVKEGDEFDENDVHRNHICYDSPGNTGCCLHCSRSMGCDSQDYNYMIKGPCGHFH